MASTKVASAKNVMWCTVVFFAVLYLTRLFASREKILYSVLGVGFLINLWSYVDFIKNYIVKRKKLSVSRFLPLFVYPVLLWILSVYIIKVYSDVAISIAWIVIASIIWALFLFSIKGLMSKHYSNHMHVYFLDTVAMFLFTSMVICMYILMGSFSNVVICLIAFGIIVSRLGLGPLKHVSFWIAITAGFITIFSASFVNHLLSVEGSYIKEILWYTNIQFLILEVAHHIENGDLDWDKFIQILTIFLFGISVLMVI